MRRVELPDWASLRSWIDTNREIFPTYWRAQRDACWPLASSFERRILGMAGGHLPNAVHNYPYGGRLYRNGTPIWDVGYIQAWRDGYLHAFQRAAAGLRGAHPAALSQDEWWALGRHFRLITPLLDWSESPYIAVFFAIHDFLMTSPRPLLLTGNNPIALYRPFHDRSLEGDGLR
ncbi:MAG TPA: FRG domain-containing protein, partial [Casimicrobiaceae bacterium]|nr:FRG domain-containing protein [Casimicrobiaceae bacterium]